MLYVTQAPSRASNAEFLLWPQHVVGPLLSTAPVRISHYKFKLQREVCTVYNIESKLQASFALPGNNLTLPVFNAHPLPHRDFLEPDALFCGGSTALQHSGLPLGDIRTTPHYFRSAPHFSGLISNRGQRENSSDYEPPVGPLKGCVPVWGAIVGVIGVCSGSLIIICNGRSRRWSLCVGMPLLGGGSLILLTGDMNCNEAQDCDYRGYPSYHADTVPRTIHTTHARRGI